MGDVNVGFGSSTTPAFNPYKFRAYRSGAWTDGNAAYAQVVFDTILFDTNNNYSTSTGNYTVPIAGFYQFNTTVQVATSGVVYSILALYKNGSILMGLDQRTEATGTNNTIQTGATLLQLAANDTIAIYHNGNGGAGGTGEVNTNFSGFLVSRA